MQKAVNHAPKDGSSANVSDKVMHYKYGLEEVELCLTASGVSVANETCRQPIPTISSPKGANRIYGYGVIRLCGCAVSMFTVKPYDLKTVHP